jgi:ribokinase
MPKCLVVSSANIDDVIAVPHFVRPGETVAGLSYSRKAGGKGANAACAIGPYARIHEILAHTGVARAGTSVSFAGHIGSDGAFLRDTLDSCKFFL